VKVSRIVRTDPLALVTLLLPLVTWAVVGLTLKGWSARPAEQSARFGQVEWTILGAAAAITAVAVPAFFARVRLIRRLFREGRHVDAKITRVVFHRERGRVGIAYELDGAPITTTLTVRRTRRTKALKPGVAIPALVDPRKPTRALLPELYLDGGLPARAAPNRADEAAASGRSTRT